MAKTSRVVGSASNIFEIFIQNSGSTVGAGLTGLVFNAASLVAYYKRDVGTVATSITLANVTTIGTFANNGLREVDSANMPGVYEFDPPNAAFNSGAKSVVFMLKGATNMAPVVLEVELTGTDNQNATTFGLSALPNAASASAGGLPTVGTGASQIDVDSSGRVNIGKWLGTIVTAATAGIPDVNAKNVANAAVNNLISGRVDTSVGAIAAGVTVTLANVQGVKKNTALANFKFVMFDSSGNPKTGIATVNCYRTIDGGTEAATATATATEISAGMYRVNLAAADLNGDEIMFRAAGSGANDTFIKILTSQA